MSNELLYDAPEYETLDRNADEWPNQTDVDEYKKFNPEATPLSTVYTKASFE